MNNCIRILNTIMRPGIFIFFIFYITACFTNTSNDNNNLNLANAKNYAGAEWQKAYNLLCHESPILPSSHDSNLIEPTKIFDNLSVLGREGTAVFLLETSEGYVLIDAFYSDQTESVLLSGLRQLNIDPNEIVMNIIAHAHRDHYGGAKFLQTNFNIPIAISNEDWNLIDEQSTRFETPIYDISISDGETLKFGDTDIHTYLVPGHTPGSLGFIFPVHDGSKTYMAGLFGGTILAFDRIDNNGLNTYLKSLEKFRNAAALLNVTVEIQNHPVIDDLESKLLALNIRSPSQPHPFVINNDSYLNFINVISECTKAELFRRL